MNMSSEKLKEMIHKVSVDDSQDAFKEIYLSFYSKLLHLAIYYVKSEEVAEEIVLDVFGEVWEKRARLAEIYNFNAYICQMVRNVSVNYIRKQLDSPRTLDGLDEHSVFSVGETPESDLISMELMNKLNDTIETLPDRCKLVFKLIREENLKYKEVAAMLNISLKTTEAHMTLAVKRLRKVIEQNL